MYYCLEWVRAKKLARVLTQRTHYYSRKMKKLIAQWFHSRSCYCSNFSRSTRLHEGAQRQLTVKLCCYLLTSSLNELYATFSRSNAKSLQSSVRIAKEAALLLLFQRHTAVVTLCLRPRKSESTDHFPQNSCSSYLLILSERKKK